MVSVWVDGREKHRECLGHDITLEWWVCDECALDCIVVEKIKPLPETLWSHRNNIFCPHCPILNPTLCQCALKSNRRWQSFLELCQPYGNVTWGSWLLASVFPNPDHCNHLENEIGWVNFSLFLSLSQCLLFLQLFKKINDF